MKKKLKKLAVKKVTMRDLDKPVLDKLAAGTEATAPCCGGDSHLKSCVK